MDELLTETAAESTPKDADLPSTRTCTRCDGQQHLVAEVRGLGKYRCDVCEMVVGFDLQADEPEFLISRGLPSRYTKNVFGGTLLGTERRLPGREPELANQD